MKILLSINGLIRTFTEAFKKIEENIITNNPQCSFEIILNTSDFNQQRSLKHNFKSNDDITQYFNEILKEYKIIKIIFSNPLNKPGIPFDRMIESYMNIYEVDNYDFIFFIRFDIDAFKKINIENIDKNILYFFDGQTSNWFYHNLDADYALFGNSVTISKFFQYNIENNYSFYDIQMVKDILQNDTEIIEKLDVYHELPFKSRWINYNEKNKKLTFTYINDQQYLNYKKPINGSLELIIFSYYCKNLYQNKFKIEILDKFKLLR